MSEAAARAIWAGVGVYAALGLIVAAALLTVGLKRIDVQAARAPWRVKLLIAPGAVALWPLLALRMAGVKPREDRR
ncbi:MAG: hypothetical protein NW203_11200 [Hyphomonadaceae bacterium]|nr:hypothetical protein [Hyphomonadaceae bacterium]